MFVRLLHDCGTPVTHLSPCPKNMCCPQLNNALSPSRMCCSSLNRMLVIVVVNATM